MEGRNACKQYLCRCDLSHCSESTEIRHADSFCVKKCRRFFQAGRKIWTQWRENPPPTLSLSVSKYAGFAYLRAETPCMCVLTLLPQLEGWESEGWGLDFHEHVWSLVSPLVEQSVGTVFHIKELACLISVDSEQLEKSQWNIGTYASLPQSPSIDTSIVLFQFPAKPPGRGSRDHAEGGAEGAGCFSTPKFGQFSPLGVFFPEDIWFS